MPRNPLRSLLWSLRGNDRSCATPLEEQIDCARSAVDLLRQAITRQEDAGAARAAVDRTELDGDRARGRVIDALAVTLAPPLDREDLFRVSRSIDDVLDNLRDLAHELELLRVDDPANLLPLMDAVDDALGELRSAVGLMGRDDQAFGDAVLRAKAAGNRVRRRYDRAMADLLVGEVDVQMLRHRELLRRLDVVGLRFGEAADALADGAIKRHW